MPNVELIDKYESKRLKIAGYKIQDVNIYKLKQHLN